MEIYLEYAILENFLVDTALLYLALVATKQTVHIPHLFAAGALGAVFALLFPFLQLPPWLSYVLKFSVGALLCLIAVKRKNGQGRYALTMLVFYALSFAFGGGLIAVFETFSFDYTQTEGGGIVTNVPIGGFLAAVAVFTALMKWGVKRLYEKRAIHNRIYECTLSFDGKSVSTRGLIDTGNTLKKSGVPVCFVTPDVIYDLFDGMESAEETTFETLAGAKRARVFAVDALKVFDGKTQTFSGMAYLSPSARLVGREYKILLSADVLKEGERL